MTESTLEDLLKLAESDSASEIVGGWIRLRDCNVGSMNALLSGKSLGDMLLKKLVEYAPYVTPAESIKMLELARFRLQLHTDNKGNYRSDYKGIDDEIYTLPAIVAEIKTASPQVDAQNTALGLFLDYCRVISPHTTLDEIKPCYGRFLKTKEFYESVPDNFRVLPSLRDKSFNCSWEKLRTSLKQSKEPQDIAALPWIDMFERVESDYKVNFKDVLRFIAKSQRHK